MSESRLGDAVESVRGLFGSRVLPNAGFVQTLREDIQYAAYQRTGQATVPFEDMVVELRKLVRLLYKTLVPVQASAAFVRALGQELDSSAREFCAARQERVRWLMLGGVLGSLLWLLGVLAALFLRRRNGRVQAKKPLGAV
ncbi:MAG: hypothetical protein JXA09_11675 [Anaerolineae bacterium]|nr:hypothetical protein [Anaerolineae bacterium]